ncbi:putative reverse transcriptase zinc-binding domain-containing protein [Helianthus annuus]|nr:putative reverse transcriptase zinc-binding domain-containing protein [Helianthus annuus]
MLIEEGMDRNIEVIKWCKWLPSKCNIFIWRTAMCRIPTRYALIKRNINYLDVMCVLCGEVEEIVDHMFTACEIPMRVWHFFCSWSRLPPLFAFSFKDMLSFYKFCKLNKEEKTVSKVWL